MTTAEEVQAEGREFARDNRTLSYRLIRDGNQASPIYETTEDSAPYNQPAMGFLDTGLVPGSLNCDNPDPACGPQLQRENAQRGALT